jgi:enediyne biosynthesis protein E4
VHFGLGSHERLDKAEITWPDGKVETVTNLAADRFYTVREGAGITASTPPSSITFKHP